MKGLLLHATFVKHRKLYIKLISDQPIDKNCLESLPLSNLICLTILKLPIFKGHFDTPLLSILRFIMVPKVFDITLTSLLLIKELTPT